MYNEIVTFYAKTPPNKGVPENYDVSFWEENRTCGDDLKVYISLSDDGAISSWSFQGDTAIITTACASIYGESIIGMTPEEVFQLGYSHIEELIGMSVSKRRQQASVLGLLTTRNALHKHLDDGQHDSFDDVLAL